MFKIFGSENFKKILRKIKENIFKKFQKSQIFLDTKTFGSQKF